MKKSSKEFRDMQRERIIKTKPWLKSKGPVSSAGKAISKMNALKVSPEIHELMKELNFIMKQQKEIYNTIDYSLL